MTGKKAHVRLVVTGADDFSGLRGSAPLKATSKQIVPGTFPKRDSVEITIIDEFKETPEELAEQPGDQPRDLPWTDPEEGSAAG